MEPQFVRCGRRWINLANVCEVVQRDAETIVVSFNAPGMEGGADYTQLTPADAEPLLRYLATFAWSSTGQGVCRG